jgi:uncharacterized membrane protein
MDPIAKAIDKTEELLGHSPHPAIVAWPLGAFVVSNVCDGLGMLTGHERYDDAECISMAIGLVGAAGAVLTGVRDYGYIPADREPNHSIATTHGLGNAVVGSLFATSYVLRSRDHAAGRRTRPLARLLALTGGTLALYTAWLGGRLVEEYGEAVKPVMEQQHAEEAGHEGDGRGLDRCISTESLGRSGGTSGHRGQGTAPAGEMAWGANI